MTNFTFSNQVAKHLNESLETLDARTALHTIKEHLDEGSISKQDAVMLCKPALLNGVLFSSIDTSATAGEIILKHTTGTPGAATGKIARTIRDAEKYIESETPFILVVPETRPEFIRYIEESEGVITFQGGSTSHAAIITRQKGKPAIIGCGRIDLKNGDEITIDGHSGIIARGNAAIKPPEPDNSDLAAILDVADKLTSEKAHRMDVRTNADTPEDAKRARDLGASGINAVRTEHMFFAEDRLPYMQAMILEKHEGKRQLCLDELFLMQKEDFKSLLKTMDGLPVTIRLLDAPLHEFIAHIDADGVADLADKLKITDSVVEQRIEDLQEHNPMLGKRSIRLGMLHPDIYEMQIRAMLEADSELKTEGHNPKLQISIPMASEVGEVRMVRNIAEKCANEITEETGTRPTYTLGITCELPTACLNADALASNLDFINIGSNDLTQTSLGLSRDDTSNVIAEYVRQGIYENNPFQTLHPRVAELIDTATKRGKGVNPDLNVSLCGEHGGDPASIHMAQKMGLDAVSVSPPRIPMARLAVAQAMLGHEVEQIQGQENTKWQERTTNQGKQQTTHSK